MNTKWLELTVEEKKWQLHNRPALPPYRAPYNIHRVPIAYLLRSRGEDFVKKNHPEAYKAWKKRAKV